MMFKKGDVLVTNDDTLTRDFLVWIERVDESKGDYLLRPLKNVNRGQYWRSGAYSVEKNYRQATMDELKLIHLLIV